MTVGQVPEGMVSDENAPVWFDKSPSQHTATIGGHAVIASFHWFRGDGGVWVHLPTELTLLQLFPADNSWDVCIYVFSEFIYYLGFRVRQMSAPIHENPAYFSPAGCIYVVVPIDCYVDS